MSYDGLGLSVQRIGRARELEQLRVHPTAVQNLELV